MRLLPIVFSNKPPYDTVFSDTPTVPDYADQHGRGQLAIYIMTASMTLAELLAPPLKTENRKIDAEQAVFDHSGQYPIDAATQKLLGERTHR